MKTFKDSKDREWMPKYTTPVLRAISEASNLGLAQLLSRDIPVHVMFTALWMGCREQAKDRKISEMQFIEDIPLTGIKEAFEVMWANLMDAFPQAGEGTTGPFAPGKTETSST
jgi:hypothetical protein